MTPDLKSSFSGGGPVTAVVRRRRTSEMEEDLQRRLSDMLKDRWAELGFDQLLPEKRDGILLWELGTEINSGTFDQYLTNSSGNHAEEAIAALERLGARELASLVRRVLDTLPGGWCADRFARWDRVEAIPGRWEVLKVLTYEWYRSGQELAAAGDRSLSRLHAAYLRVGLVAELSR
jgi:hypothetical protein